MKTSVSIMKRKINAKYTPVRQIDRRRLQLMQKVLNEETADNKFRNLVLQWASVPGYISPQLRTTEFDEDIVGWISMRRYRRSILRNTITHFNCIGSAYNNTINDAIFSNIDRNSNLIPEEKSIVAQSHKRKKFLQNSLQREYFANQYSIYRPIRVPLDNNTLKTSVTLKNWNFLRLQYYTRKLKAAGVHVSSNQLLQACMTQLLARIKTVQPESRTFCKRYNCKVSGYKKLSITIDSASYKILQYQARALSISVSLLADMAAKLFLGKCVQKLLIGMPQVNASNRLLKRAFFKNLQSYPMLSNKQKNRRYIYFLTPKPGDSLSIQDGVLVKVPAASRVDTYKSIVNDTIKKNDSG